MIDQLPMRRGHFLLESGHHGNVWLDLELLCLVPDRVRPFARQMAEQLQKYDAQIICGPLVEGAFLAMMVASEMGLPFTYSVPLPEEKPADLSPSVTSFLRRSVPKSTGSVSRWSTTSSTWDPPYAAPSPTSRLAGPFQSRSRH